jgi:hypothetical protein
MIMITYFNIYKQSIKAGRYDRLVSANCEKVGLVLLVWSALLTKSVYFY